MLSMKIESLVAALVRHELVGKGRENEALYFNFDLRMGSYTDGESYNQSRGLHLLYQVNPGYSYITVFSGITPSPFDKIKDVKEWKHECTHDSCWRDIQVFSQVYFEMAKQINEARVQDGLPEIAPAEMHEHNSFPLFNQTYLWVPVRITKDPNDAHNYRKLVEVL